MKSLQLGTDKIHTGLIAIVDFLEFWGFLALLVTNGIIVRAILCTNDKIFALIYNSFPWIISAYVRIFGRDQDGTVG